MKDVYFRTKSMRGFIEDGKRLSCHSEEVKKNNKNSNKEIGKFSISSLKQAFLLACV